MIYQLGEIAEARRRVARRGVHPGLRRGIDRDHHVVPELLPELLEEEEKVGQVVFEIKVLSVARCAGIFPARSQLRPVGRQQRRLPVYIDAVPLVGIEIPLKHLYVRCP